MEAGGRRMLVQPFVREDMQQVKLVQRGRVYRCLSGSVAKKVAEGQEQVGHSDESK